MKKFALICVCICMMFSLCACTIRSNKQLSDDELEEMKEEYADYLEETYPGEEFTIEVWQEYAEKGGAAGLPDYEGYLMRQVITDSEGNRFKIFTSNPGVYSDDRQKVLDGKVHYNEKGQEVFYKDNGEEWFVDD